MWFIGEGNRELLKLIENSLGLLCLDQKPLGDAFQRRGPARGAKGMTAGARDETNMTHQMLHGGGSVLNTPNRWFDKTIQVLFIIMPYKGISASYTRHAYLHAIQADAEFIFSSHLHFPHISIFSHLHFPHISIIFLIGFQIVIGSDGVSGLCYEHSTSEAVSLLSIMDHILTDMSANWSPSEEALSASDSALVELKWSEPPQLNRIINEAARFIDK